MTNLTALSTSKDNLNLEILFNQKKIHPTLPDRIIKKCSGTQKFRCRNQEKYLRTGRAIKNGWAQYRRNRIQSY